MRLGTPILGIPSGQQATGGGAAPVVITPGAYEDFVGTAASSLHGKTTTLGALTWAAVLGNSGVTTQIKLTGTGEAYGLATTGSTATSPTLISPGYADQRVWGYRISPKATAFAKAGASSVGVNMAYTGDGSTNSWSKEAFGPAAMSAGATTLRAYSTTGATGAATGTNRDNAANPGTWAVAGDTFEWRQKNTGGVITRDLYQNGRLMFVGTFDYAGSGVTNTGSIGPSGVLEAAATRPLSDIWTADLATQGFVSVDRPARVAQLNDDLSITLNLYGEYNLTAPTGLTVSVYNGSTEVLLTGMGSVSLTSFVAAAGVWSGVLAIPAASMPAANGPFFCRVERDLGAGNTTYGFTPLQYPGEVMEEDGQSLSDNGFGVPQAVVVPYGMVVDGINVAAAVDRRIMPQGTSSNPHSCASDIMGQMGTLSGLASTNVCMLRSCKGGTFLQDPVTPANGREIGFAAYTAAKDCIKRGGNRHAVLIYTGGQFESVDTHHLDMTTIANQTAYKNALIAQIDDKDATIGRALKVGLSGNGGFNNAGTDSNVEAVRRLHYWLAFTFPTRFFTGPHYSDITHGTDGVLGSDTYHPASVGFRLYSRRKAYTWAKLRGYVAVDRAGPFVAAGALTRLSATQLKLRVSKNGATTIDVVNSAFASDFSGGGLFSNGDSTFGAGNLKVPTAYSVTDIDANFADVTWTFAAASFPGTAYFKIHVGHNPFNRADDATVAAAMETKASMLSGIYSDDTVAIQPFYDFSNPALQSAYTTDWLSAS